MPEQILLDADHLVFLLCLSTYCVLAGTYAWILASFLLNRRSGQAREREWLSWPLPADNSLPNILVQIPTYNEGNLVRRIAGAIAELDWPRDRLNVQILDDSTDDSLAESERAAGLLRGNGITAAVLHRDGRDGFKAGALGEGLLSSDEPFICILDADYVPAPDFLRRCMRPLLRDGTVALVQARCDYLNGGENLVTRVQQRILDAHFLVEQAARTWSNQLVPFNGTCGIWRRKAIDVSGGWHGDTLAEDMDLSYRVQLAGWRNVFLADVTVPGELPRTFQAWRRQQFRWTKGSAEVTRKLFSAVWRSSLSFRQKVVSSLHLGGGLFGFVFGILLVSGAIDIVIGRGLTVATLVLLITLAVEGLGGPAVLQLVGQKFARNANLASEAGFLPIVTALRLAVGLANVGAGVEALIGRSSEFVRTPKLHRPPAGDHAAEVGEYVSRH